ncbi:MAG: succinate dehydrogenase assembly factor 2 [Gammaproteobacteria bacterium]|nr:MAG: succinate dehydrogenase assembly factor 2 [Gammaproteobacteria bacterium]
MGRPDAETLHRLRWQCRRGMLELDEILLAYLENRYPEAPEAEQAAFRELLTCEDPLLQRWLLLGEEPETALRDLVERLRGSRLA